MPKGTTSPRRLSRVRQPPLPSHSTTSTSSHASSTRQERSTRSHHKASSPQKSSTPQSLSSEEASAMEEARSLRRSKRTHDNDDDDAKIEDADADEVDGEIVEDEETTRCICGYPDYPGPPVDHTLPKRSQPPSTADDAGDDRGGLFIQCDDCQVWQHGGCVSLMEEAEVPDNYYCEECKPDLHELLKSPNGQKFSHYLPVWSKTHPKTARKGSVDKDDKKTQKERERQARSSALPETKRRSTMNSRAAYDEDEVLRKVLEESKTEGQGSTENGSRKGKRNRDDSEDPRIGIKRQRTASSVLSSHSGDDSAIESETEKTSTLKKLPKQATAPKNTTAIKTEKAAADTTVVKRRGGRRNGGDAGEQSDISSGATWECRCGLWACLCRPSLTRGDTGAASADNNNKDSSSGSGSNKDKEGGRQNAHEAEDEESVPPQSARPSAKASPVAEADVPDTPTLGTSSGTGKKGRKGGGRGRSNPAPTPADRDDAPTLRGNGANNDTAENGDATPVPTVTLNGTSSKRGKRGQQHLQNQKEQNTDSADNSDKDPSNIPTAHQSESELHHDNTHHTLPIVAAGAAKKKEPSMNELKRRAAAMLDWVERAQQDLGRATLVSQSMSPQSGSLSPPDANGFALGGPVGGGQGELGGVAEMLHTKLLGWQVEYGTG